MRALLFSFLITISVVNGSLFAGLSESAHSIKNLQDSMVSWADYNNDGYMDFVISGQDPSNYNALSTLLYKNNSGTSFTLAQDLGVGIRSGSIRWGDYDNDGDIDMVITGHVDDNYGLTKIFRNDSGTLVDSKISLQKAFYSAVDWGDYNNDGYLDLALMGFSSGKRYAIVYKNNGDGTFSDSGQSLTGSELGVVVWADYNNDGFQDLALTGRDTNGNGFCYIYKNSQGVLGNPVSIKKAVRSSFAWADYDNDGNMDFAISGSTKNTRDGGFVEIYHNKGPSSNFQFVSSITLTGVYWGDLAWGDYNNDGRIDLAVCGEKRTLPATRMTAVYRNDGNAVFTDIGASLKGLYLGKLCWADYDNDKDLDLIITGSSSTAAGQFTRIYNNDEANGGNPNYQPPKVTQFRSRYYNGKLYMMWNDPASDANEETTPYTGFYYDFRVGTSSGTDDLVPARYGSPLLGNYLTKTNSSDVQDSDIAAGRVDVSSHRNVRVMAISGPNYYWAVQTIDTSLGYSWADSYSGSWSEQQVYIDSSVPTGLSSVPTDEGMYTYSKTMKFNWTKGTAADHETGIYGCYIQIKEVGLDGAESLVVSKELSEKLVKTVWKTDGSAEYEHTGSVNNTYYARVKARHGYDQSIPTDIYRPDLHGTSGDPDGLWVYTSPHYTSWTEWSNGIMVVELLTVNNNVIRDPGTGGDAVEIFYSITKDSKVTIRIFNILGELVKVILDDDIEVGNASIEKWYGLTDSGDAVSSGVYYINIIAGGKEDTKKVMVVK